MRIFLSLIVTCALLVAHPVSAKNFIDDISANQATHANESKSVSEPKSAWQSTVQEIMMNALSLTGIKYRYGGTSPETGFDCSGFVRYVFGEAASIALPHNARSISQVGKMISTEELQPGDLVFFNTMKSAFSHVGIYMGNNRFIHAPSSGGGVHIVDMDSAYWAKRFDGARRILGIHQPNATKRDID
jgi:cell wall-associated NlpC family hydrolase